MPGKGEADSDTSSPLSPFSKGPAVLSGMPGKGEADLVTGVGKLETAGEAEGGEGGG